jgi:hypothetical protein
VSSRPPRSRRTLFLTAELLELLRRHRARLAEERIAIGPAWREHDLIFPSALGTPLDPDNVSHWFSRICRRAGLGHWHLHELRHSGASLMLAQGTDLCVVSEVLGHSSVVITKDVYGHLVEGQKRAAAARMSQALLTPKAPAMAPRARPHRARMLDEREKAHLTRVNIGAPGEIRTPNLLIRSYARESGMLVRDSRV